MKWSMGIISVFFLLLATGCAEIDYVPAYRPNQDCKLVTFKPGSEPSGINGIKWGTELSTLQDMVRCKSDSSPCKTDSGRGGIDFYEKKDDGLLLKNRKLIPLRYGFWRGKLYVGMVMTQGRSDWDVLKETVFEKYGEGAKPFSNKDEYLWLGRDATMALRFDDFTGAGTYYIRSCSVEKKMEQQQAMTSKK